MRVEIAMPTLGYDMEAGKISSWLVAVGDAIERGQPIAEIETDKATIEMESLQAGTLVEIVHGPATRSPSAGRSPISRWPGESDGRLIEQTRMRAAIARRMSESKQQAFRISMSQTEIRRRPGCSVRPSSRLNAGSSGRPGHDDGRARARVRANARRAHPAFECSLGTADGLLEVADDINIGVAIARRRRTHRTGACSNCRDRSRCPAMRPAPRRPRQAHARTQKLRAAEMSDATFTVSNLGMFDVSAVHGDHDAAAGRDPRCRPRRSAR